MYVHAVFYVKKRKETDSREILVSCTPTCSFHEDILEIRGNTYAEETLEKTQGKKSVELIFLDTR